MTLGEVWTYYLEKHAKPHKRSWLADEQRYKRHLKEWEGRRLVAITTGEAQALHNRIGKESGHYEANQLRALLHSMYAVATAIPGVSGRQPGRERAAVQGGIRERFLHGDEMPKFFEALDALREEHPTAADAIAVALWTGARRGNVLSMTWDELALDRATWTVPGEKFKNGKQQTVHSPLPCPGHSQTAASRRPRAVGFSRETAGQAPDRPH